MQYQIPSLISHHLPDASSIQYQVGHFLGKGGFARCYQGTNLATNEQVAIKVISKANLKKSRAKQKLLLEITIHRHLNHRNIVKFNTVFEDKKNVYIILQLCTCRTLSEMVKKRKFLTPPEVRFFLLQLISALQYLHSLKIIHRDLKMGNIFLSDNMELKVGDFGLSAKLEFNDERKKTMAGTPNYIAPEIIDGCGGHSYEVDIWSTGVICYALLFGRPPFESSEIKMTYNRIKNCEYCFPNFHSVPQTAKDFIKKILILDPVKRSTLNQMLAHPFLKESVPVFIPHLALVQPPHLIMMKSKAIDKDRKQNNTHDVKSVRYSGVLETMEKPCVAKFRSAKILQEKKPNQDQTVTTNLTSKLSEKLNQNIFEMIVSSHADYSTKYGLGYEITNGCIGVYFNDSTLLSVHSHSRTYEYIVNPSQCQVHEKYDESNLPNQRNFNKKKLLLEKIQSYLPNQTNLTQLSNDQEPHIYIKQWLKTKHAIMFRLSNNIFQVNFFDNSQILLHTEHKTLKFTNKKGLKKCYTLCDAINDGQTELGRRIKYTRQILNSLKKEKKEGGQ